MLQLDQMKTLYLKAKEAYYNDEPIMSDEEFDMLEDKIRALDSNWVELDKTGVAINGKKFEVKLPYFMPSLNKFYPEQSDKLLQKFASVKQCVIMPKLDGSSVLIEYKQGKPVRLITRGNGEYGKDCSFLIPCLRIQTIKDVNFNYCIRCEAIITRDEYKNWTDEFDNARNMVSGLLNRREAHAAMKKIHFVALGLFGLPLLEGLTLLRQRYKHTIEYNTYDQSELANQYLANFEAFKNSSYMYDADGIVIADADFTYEYKNADKPKSSIFAFKINAEDTAVQAEVKQIIWQTSGFGRLVPKIEIKPTLICGAKVKYATAHNAQWLIERKIGPGAIVKMVRSGDVIPKIIDVIKPTENLQYPTVAYEQRGVHFFAIQESDEQIVNSLTRSLDILNVDGAKKVTVTTLYEKLNISSIDDILSTLNHSASTFNAQLIELLGPVRGNKLYNALLQLTTTSYTVIDWMLASNTFDAGIGRRRLVEISKHCDLNTFNEELISQVPGIGEQLLQMLKQSFAKFDLWLKTNGQYIQPFKKISHNSVSGILSGIRFTFTGYRSEDQEKTIRALGGEIISFSAKTDILLYKQDGKASSKIAKAGDKAMTWNELCQKYPELSTELKQHVKTLF